MNYFVHYTVLSLFGSVSIQDRLSDNPCRAPGEPQHLVAGPYSESEVLDQRRDIASYANVVDAYVSVSDSGFRVKS
jgi:hypothetical protein